MRGDAAFIVFKAAPSVIRRPGGIDVVIVASARNLTVTQYKCPVFVSVIAGMATN